MPVRYTRELLDISPFGSNQAHITRRIAPLNIDTSPTVGTNRV
jgi:hypothetical protein